MFLAAIWSSFCFGWSLTYGFIPPLIALARVTRKHWPPVHGPPLRTGSVDYLRTSLRTTPTDPTTDHPPKLNKIENRNKDFTYFLSMAIDHSRRKFERYTGKMQQTWVQSRTQLRSLTFHIAIFFFAVAISIHERPGNLREASKFVLLWVHFLRHFVRPILPQVRELVPVFTICQAEFEIKTHNAEGKEITNFLGFPVFHAKLQQRKWQRCKWSAMT